ncbi:MaoC family dehydratase [Exilibacterium tricleocarpae]|uniref:MaoC family dehydratase n=2 Tax=Exilibacterium tricleocarpae TaxID=2591008 RepID=A0A545U9I9_9GAMM|nr:MaoC family dehydratase [Exilibacterium tricleocarpae]
MSEPSMQNVSNYDDLAGQDLGVTPWLELTQDRITAFGGITLDFDPHHIDPRQAADGPFGVAAAQGFLTLSLLTHFAGMLADRRVPRQHINYGFNRVRFIRPAVVGSRLRAAFKCRSVSEREPGQYLLVFDVTVEADNDDKPVMTAEWLALIHA